MAGMIGASYMALLTQHQALQTRVNELERCLDGARNGLVWYSEACPHLRDGSDDEMLAEIARLIGSA